MPSASGRVNRHLAGFRPLAEAAAEATAELTPQGCRP